jgi:hypothetical protein
VAVPAWALGARDRPDEVATVGQQPEDESTETTAPTEPALTPEPGSSDTTEPASAPSFGDPFGSTAPWDSAPALAQADVPEFVEAWTSDAEAQAQCPLLAVDDLGEGAGATPRATDRGQPGAWWVEFDLPGAPGEVDIQMPDVNAGRATFYVSAILGGPPVDASVGARWPDQHTWDDGSAVGWGVSGDGIEGPIQPNGWPTSWISYMYVQGSPCLYQVGSYLSRDHLTYLIDHLRRVEGAP